MAKNDQLNSPVGAPMTEVPNPSARSAAMPRSVAMPKRLMGEAPKTDETIPGGIYVTKLGTMLHALDAHGEVRNDVRVLISDKETIEVEVLGG